MPSKKIFVVISSRTKKSPGLYSDWTTVQHEIQGIKKAAGIRLVWKSFEGTNREEDALDYWHSHHEEAPTIHSSEPSSSRRPRSPSREPARGRSKSRDPRDRSRSTYHDEEAPRTRRPREDRSSSRESQNHTRPSRNTSRNRSWTRDERTRSRSESSSILEKRSQKSRASSSRLVPSNDFQIRRIPAAFLIPWTSFCTVVQSQ